MATTRVAVLGGGLSASSFVHALSRAAGPRVQCTLFEMGRGPGGRCAVRKSREDPRLAVAHGAPHALVRTQAFAELLAFAGASPTSAAEPAGALDGAGAGWRARSGGAAAPAAPAVDGAALHAACAALQEQSQCERVFGVMVRGIMRKEEDHTWALFDKQGVELGRYEWLVVSGSGVAHPRWTAAFGGEPPLLEASRQVNDPTLDRALAGVAKVESVGVTAALLAFDGDAGAAWAALPFAVADVEGDGPLARVVVQRLEGGLTAVVAHSTAGFAARAADVYGRTSTAARVGGAGADAAREDEVLAELVGALRTALVVPGLLPESALEGACYGPHLHRWGAAFPGGQLLPLDDAVVPSARVAFVGDYVATEHPGQAEGAALSGLAAAAAVASALPRVATL